MIRKKIPLKILCVVLSMMVLHAGETIADASNSSQSPVMMPLHNLPTSKNAISASTTPLHFFPLHQVQSFKSLPVNLRPTLSNTLPLKHVAEMSHSFPSSSPISKETKKMNEEKAKQILSIFSASH